MGQNQSSTLVDPMCCSCRNGERQSHIAITTPKAAKRGIPLRYDQRQQPMSTAYRQEASQVPETYGGEYAPPDDEVRIPGQPSSRGRWKVMNLKDLKNVKNKSQGSRKDPSDKENNILGGIDILIPDESRQQTSAHGTHKMIRCPR
jgi:hypothetical protein